MTAQKDGVATTATIESLWIAAEAAGPMEPRKSLALIPGVGAEGDRYALTARKGCYSARFFDEPGRHLTMVSGEGFLDAAERAGLEPLPIEALRRNVVLRGISIDELNAAVGHEVRIGACRLFVHRRIVQYPGVPLGTFPRNCGDGGRVRPCPSGDLGFPAG